MLKYLPSHHKKVKNEGTRDCGENAGLYVAMSEEKNTFEWLKVVSKVSFPRFWGGTLYCKVVSVFRLSEVILFDTV